MTYSSNMSNSLIPKHGGYRNLKSYQTTEIIYDLTVKFCDKYLSYPSNKSYTRTIDQMVQAARSGKQNIAEGSQASGTSKKTELKLVNVARASQEELLLDYEDYLRQHSLPLWVKNHPETQKIRALAYSPNRSCMIYLSYLSTAENAANCLICLIHQANYLLDQQLRQLESDFLKYGSFTERLYSARQDYKNKT